MVNTKTIVLLIAALVLVAAVAGIAFVQYASAQLYGNGNSTSQTPQGASGTYYPYPQQGYCPYGSAQNGYSNSYGYGYGRGMCGCFR